MNIAGVLGAAARLHAGRTAVAWIDRPVWTYAQLWDRAATLAAGFAAAGLKPGDRVVMAMSNAPAYYEVLIGAWIAGLVPAPQNCRLHAAEIAFAAQDCGARLCIATPDLAAPLAAALGGLCPLLDVDGADFAALHGHGAAEVVVRAPTDAALLFYTSGTTGKPKAAIHTHRTLNAMLVSFLADSGAVVEDHILHIAPMSHASGFLGLSYLARGRGNIVLPTGAFDPDLIARAAAAFGSLSFFAVPTIVRRLTLPDCLDETTIASIHRIFFGGAPMYLEDLKRAIARFGSGRLWHLYGQGETPNTITHLPPHLLGAPGDPDYADRLASVGVARSGVSVRILRDDGTAAATGEVGEVAVQGDTLMAGYWNRPEATVAAMKDGWLRTGDLGRLDARGFLTLVDRSKDMIISGGSNVYPREIEEALLTHPGVAECAVVGQADPEWGETAVAFIVTAGTAPDPADLDAHVLARLARYKRPRAYHFLSELPKNAYGKVLKTALRDR
ncbi:MAG: AMP-binding protein [Sphingopyxis sp.]|nr:AMP-binding protein [Sphingopyxis sp.]